MIVVIDNYDSFVQNLARYVRLTGHETQIIRNDAMSVEDVLNFRPKAIIISPGPYDPQRAGISVELIRAAYQETPILGVCLGHQAIAAAFGADVVKAKRPMHGLASIIHHNEQGIFKSLPNPLNVGRYHSLIVNLPHHSILESTAISEEGEVMALKHRDYPVYGVQFHPESVLTENGMQLIENFCGDI
jgi:anthranilate synthase/aminodeoxychorismate synthase-like glutamine amidotransferase